MSFGQRIIRRLYSVGVATEVATDKVYPPRKQLVWNQCQEYLKKRTLLLVHLDNMDTKARQALKLKLKAHKLSMVNPKPHILRKVLRESPWSSLESAVIGPTVALISNKPANELKTALDIINSPSQKMILLGGKVDEHVFYPEGITDLSIKVPEENILQCEFLSLLSHPAQVLIQTLNKAPQLLASSLEQHHKLRLEKEEQ